MRVAILLGGLLVVGLAAAGIYYSPNLLNPAAKPRTPTLDEAKAIAEKEAYAREHLGYISLVDRLPKGKPISPTHALDAEAKKFWEILDGNLARSQNERAE